MIGNCTWRYGLVNGVKTDIQDAEKGVHGICPLCGGELVPRKGTIRNWHWWHINGRLCDNWYEPKGEWHRAWQGCFARDWREVSRTKFLNGEESKHIADIFTDNGWTIEFQYSHLNSEKIAAREEFYVEMVWVVNGCRLERDRAIGDELKELPRINTVYGNLPYSVRENSRESPWFHSDKLVFFDYEGGFDNPCLDGILYCLLPKSVDGHQIWVQVKKSDFIEAFNTGREKEFLETIKTSSHDYQIRLEEEARRRKEEEEKLADIAKREVAARRERAWHEELEHPAKLAITLGWLQASLWIDRVICDCKITEGISDDFPMSGKIAIHYLNDYPKEAYEGDLEYVKAHYQRPVHGWPQYEHLKKRKGCIVAKACFKKEYDEDKKVWTISIYDFTRLVDYSGHIRVLHNVHDGEGIWSLSDVLLKAVNDRKYREPPNPPRKKVQNGSMLETNSASKELPDFKYTGKGNLYRNTKTNWLHILKNGVMIPLKRENQNWDATYDAHFHKRKESK